MIRALTLVDGLLISVPANTFLSLMLEPRAMKHSQTNFMHLGSNLDVDE